MLLFICHLCYIERLKSISRKDAKAQRRSRATFGRAITHKNLRARAKTGSHFQSPIISISGVAKIRNMPDISQFLRLGVFARVKCFFGSLPADIPECPKMDHAILG